MTEPNADDLQRADTLTRYLHENIPLSQFMQIRVLPSAPGSLWLSAPQAPNRNPHNTVFGGSLATLSIAAGWTLLFDAMRREGLDAALVIQKHECDYRAPSTTEFIAEAVLPQEWPAFVAQVRERGRARLKLPVRITCEGREVFTANALYAAFKEG